MVTLSIFPTYDNNENGFLLSQLFRYLLLFFRRWAVLVALLSVVSSSSFASEEFFPRLDLAGIDQVSDQEISDNLYVYEDVEGQASLEEVLLSSLEWQTRNRSSSLNDLSEESSSGVWHRVKHNPPNFGYSHSVYWFHLPLLNAAHFSSDWVVEVAYPVLDFVDLYVVKKGDVQSFYKLGDKQPFSNRVFEHRNFRIPVTLSPLDEVDIFIRVKTSSAVQVPVRLWSYGGLMKYDQIDILIIGVYFGLLLVMALYNGLIYLTVRQRSNLYYVFYVVSYGFFQASLIGLAYQYIWPSGVHWNDQSILVSLALSLVFGTIFIRSYLDLRLSSPRLELFYRGATWLGVVCIVLSFVLSYDLMIRVMVFSSTVICLCAMAGGLYLWRSIGRSIQYFTLAWLFLFAGGLILALNKFGVLPRNLFTENASLYGSALQIILLSMALVEQINMERKKRFAAQQRAIVQERLAREAQEHALALQRQDNERLEQRVQERTAELEALNDKLQELTIRDSLTGLYNRRYLDTKAEEEYKRAQRDRNSLAVLVMDLDNFKQINDKYGHLFGDTCLVATAKVLSDNVQRTSDTIARYGGEEFVAILPGASKEKARYLAEMIRLNIMSLEMTFEGKRVPLSMSIGFVATKPKEVGRYEELIKLADEALYKAKEAGRNRVIGADDSPNLD
ncbi:sensor domain-containing diguanylate cyclase [Litoribrevibacter albus]|uniref:diguanylate cyclase n=1 Tax=Litoribrevibacter albus TaxID=1473156 RepID=A0AA37W6X0_9GAMM|nr:diguanylate cyclase [Litoribrevibacter albus]GLQ30613.1 deoxynucleoside kinase [Litoribrevibacter albus]